MIAISAALKIIDAKTNSLGAEKVAIDASVGRILREDIVADTDMPPFDRSQMDGFAVVAADTIATPATLTIVGESAAGKGWHKSLRRGEAVRIMTGAPVPKGADAVQKIELTNENRASYGKPAGQAVQTVGISEHTEQGRHIVYRGSEIKKGTTIFREGAVVTENMIATLAAFGYSSVKISRPPRVAILGTGSEIVEIEKKPGRDQIRNSNSVMLDVLCRKFGAETKIFPIVKDEISDLKFEISKAAESSNIVVLTGGVSVGKYDYTKTALDELGAEIFFDKVRLKPGKPVVFARIGKTLVFGLPGNPVSAAVTFHLFVRKAILKMQGATATEMRTGFAVLAANAKAARERDTYLPSRLETNKLGQSITHPLKWQGSSDFVGFAQADSLIFVAKGKMVANGEVARVVYL